MPSPIFLSLLTTLGSKLISKSTARFNSYVYYKREETNTYLPFPPFRKSYILPLHGALSFSLFCPVEIIASFGKSPGTFNEFHSSKSTSCFLQNKTMLILHTVNTIYFAIETIPLNSFTRKQNTSPHTRKRSIPRNRSG